MPLGKKTKLDPISYFLYIEKLKQVEVTIFFPQSSNKCAGIQAAHIFCKQLPQLKVYYLYTADFLTYR